MQKIDINQFIREIQGKNINVLSIDNNNNSDKFEVYNLIAVNDKNDFIDIYDNTDNDYFVTCFDATNIIKYNYIGNNIIYTIKSDNVISFIKILN